MLDINICNLVFNSSISGVSLAKPCCLPHICLPHCYKSETAEGLLLKARCCPPESKTPRWPLPKDQGGQALEFGVSFPSQSRGEGGLSPKEDPQAQAFCVKCLLSAGLTAEKESRGKEIVPEGFLKKCI